MARTHLDRKNVALAGTIYQLRQAIDVYRIIGLNVTAARKASLSMAFFGYTQQVSLDLVALTICKIFEFEKARDPKKPERHMPVVSIHGVMGRLKHQTYSASQVKAIERFGRKYRNAGACTNPTDFLHNTILLFKQQHKLALERLRDYRNQHVAHYQFGVPRAKFRRLPSLDEFEAIYEFSADFYRLISDGILNIGSALIDRRTGFGLVRTFQALGIENARYDFPKKQSA